MNRNNPNKPVWNGIKLILKFLKRSSMISKIVICDAKFNWFVANKQKHKTLVRCLNWISRKCTIMTCCILILWYKMTYLPPIVQTNCQNDILVNSYSTRMSFLPGKSHTPWYTSRFCAQNSTRLKFDPWGSYRLSEASVVGTALHIEGFDLSRETTEKDGLVDAVCHQPLWSLGDVLRARQTTDKSKQRSKYYNEATKIKRISSVKRQDIKPGL